MSGVVVGNEVFIIEIQDAPTTVEINEVTNKIQPASAGAEGTIEVISNPTNISINIDETETLLYVSEQQFSVIEIGIQGPMGPAGPSGGEDEIPYAQQVDFEGSTIYKGWAAVGSSTSSSLWRIQKIEFVGLDEDVVITWADGDSNFDNIWDNRVSLSYS